MAGTLSKCISCQRVFWPEAGGAGDGSCPDCRRAESTSEPAAAAPVAAPRRFVALSRVPEENQPEPLRRPIEPRLPTLPGRKEFTPSPVRQSGPPPIPESAQTEVPPQSSAGAGVIPLPANPSRPEPAPVPMIPPGPLPQMAFNCPACFTVLVITNPASYDGAPAPCPYCRTKIAPPRIAQASPFTLLNPPPPQG